MQYCAAPRLEAACRIRFSLKKCCTTCRPRPSPPKIAAVGHPHAAERHVRVIGRHVERPQVLVDGEARRADRGEEGGDAVGVAWLAAGPGEDQVVRGGVHAGVPGLLAGDHPVAAIADGRGLHERGVAAVRGLGDAEREAPASGRQVLDPVGLLLRGAVLDHQQQARRCCPRSCARSAGRSAGRGPWRPGARGSPPCRDSCRPGRRTWPGTRTGSGRPRRPGVAPRPAAPPSPCWAGRRGPSRYARPRGGGRRSECCRPGAPAA